MLKQLAVYQKVFGAIILLFAWSLSIKQAAADEWNGSHFYPIEVETPFFRQQFIWWRIYVVLRDYESR